MSKPPQIPNAGVEGTSVFQVANLPYIFRPLASNDDIASLTNLVRVAYQKLGEMGLRYTATWQDDAVTLRRAQQGECFLLIEQDQMVGTITLEPPAVAKGSPWYDRPEVASFHQFAVHPRLQGSGAGSAMLDFVEQRAKDLGAEEIALDTAEPALHLIKFYERRGYRFIEHAQWKTTNYRSVIMSKKLS